MDEFAREWTYRDPMVTVTYPKGWAGSLPAVRRKKAEQDGALVVAEPDATEDAPDKPKRTRKKAE